MSRTRKIPQQKTLDKWDKIILIEIERRKPENRGKQDKEMAELLNMNKQSYRNLKNEFIIVDDWYLKEKGFI